MKRIISAFIIVVLSSVPALSTTFVFSVESNGCINTTSNFSNQCVFDYGLSVPSQVYLMDLTDVKSFQFSLKSNMCNFGSTIDQCNTALIKPNHLTVQVSMDFGKSWHCLGVCAFATPSVSLTTWAHTRTPKTTVPLSDRKPGALIRIAYTEENLPPVGYPHVYTPIIQFWQ